MRNERDPFYLSPAWKRKARQIMIRDRYQCQISKRYGRLRPAELVHHVFPKDEFPEYAYKDWNLIAVSRDAHHRLHNPDGDLSEFGREVLRRIASKNNIPIPEQYVLKKTRIYKHKTERLLYQA